MVLTLFIYLLAIVCWLGGMVFFALLTAPAVFTTLPITEAGKVMAVFFPRYYLMGYIAGAIASLLAIYFTAAAWAPAMVELRECRAGYRPRNHALRGRYYSAASGRDPHRQ